MENPYDGALDRTLEDACTDDAGNPRTVRVLHAFEDGTGNTAVVFELEGVRHYWADAYTLDGPEDDPYMNLAYGYHTTEPACYMGRMWRGLFGPFEREVFTFAKPLQMLPVHA